MAKIRKAKRLAADWRRCRVEASVISIEHNYSRALGPGGMVDLEEKVSSDLKLRDFVLESWFEPEDPGPPNLADDLNEGDQNGTSDRP